MRHDPLRLALKAFTGGDLPQAERLYQRILRQAPTEFNALHMLGIIRARQKRFPEAERLLAKALENGRSPEALSNHGNVLSELGRHAEAIRQLRHAVMLRPDSAECHYNLGNALAKADHLEEAAKAYAAAVSIMPDFAHALKNYADVLREMGCYGESVVLVNRAIALNPRDPDLRIDLGVALQEFGKLEEAKSAFVQALAVDPQATAAFYHIVRMGKVTLQDSIVEQMEQQARLAPNLSAERQAMLDYALGKAYEDLGRFDEAFERLLQANRLVRSSITYDEALQRRRFERLTTQITADLLSQRTGWGFDSDVPIFVLGFPRSGTTLTEQILASHPAVYGAGENSYVSNLASSDLVKIPGSAPAGEAIGFPESLAHLPPERFREMGRLYVESLRRAAPASARITDKLPANFTFIGFIRLILPRAKIIHVRRDPIDTCVSCFAQRFRQSNIGFSYDLAELGRHYRDYLEMMEHWRRVLPAGSMLEIRYEDLVDDLETGARQIIDYCGLPWDERCLSFHEHGRAVQTASLTQVRKPIYRSSVERWRRYERHLGPLIDALGLGDARESMPGAAKPGFRHG